MPPDETFTTRPGAAARRLGINSSASSSGPVTLVAKLSSIPSADFARSGGMTPALLTRASSFGTSVGERGGELTDRLLLGDVAAP